MSPFHHRDEGLRAEVVAYSGSRGEEEPRVLRLEGEEHEVSTILERWVEPGGRGFRVSVADGSVHLLFCRESDLTWWRLLDPRKLR